jgi:hypothetical protein
LLSLSNALLFYYSPVLFFAKKQKIPPRGVEPLSPG